MCKLVLRRRKKIKYKFLKFWTRKKSRKRRTVLVYLIKCHSKLFLFKKLHQFILIFFTNIKTKKEKKPWLDIIITWKLHRLILNRSNYIALFTYKLLEEKKFFFLFNFLSSLQMSNVQTHILISFTSSKIKINFLFL